jgi:lysine decarboxylase
MPGHSGLYNDDDITELSYSGNLLNKDSLISSSKQLVAEVYGVENSTYITNGATCAVHVVARALRDKTFLIVGDCHMSIFSAIRLYNITAYYVERHNMKVAILMVKPEVIFYTSVDYFGNVYHLDGDDLGNAILVADEAHGAHLVFSDLTPKSAVLQADIVIHSPHKTMPVPTGGALLHYTSVFDERIRVAISEIHSSSPSYLILAALERAIAEFSEHGIRYYIDIFNAIECFKANLNNSFVLCESNATCEHDFTRLVLQSKFSASSVCKCLEEKNIFGEACIDDKLVYIVTPYNYTNLGTLLHALNSIPDNLPPCKQHSIEINRDEICLIKNYDKFREIDLSEALGKISYREICVYPPGTPLVLPGDVFTTQIINFVKEYEDSICGVENNRVFVVK